MRIFSQCSIAKLDKGAKLSDSRTADTEGDCIGTKFVRKDETKDKRPQKEEADRLRDDRERKSKKRPTAMLVKKKKKRRKDENAPLDPAISQDEMVLLEMQISKLSWKRMVEGSRDTAVTRSWSSSRES